MDLNTEIRTANGLLPAALIDSIRVHSHKQQEHRLNLTSWPPGVVGVSGPIMLFDVPKEDAHKVMVACEKLVGIPADDPAYKWSVTYTLGGRLSFIPWHADDRHVAACTIYLNDVWKRDWGGAFVYEHGFEDIRVVYPEPNKAVAFSPPLKHATFMPTLDAPLRETIQIFVDRLEDIHGIA